VADEAVFAVNAPHSDDEKEYLHDPAGGSAESDSEPNDDGWEDDPLALAATTQPRRRTRRCRRCTAQAPSRRAVCNLSKVSFLFYLFIIIIIIYYLYTGTVSKF
jgi:hypothetical protein